MSYDGWITYNGVEIVNLSRTAQLAQTLGIDSVWITPESVAWIQASLGGANYNDISTAPWYDVGYPASSEFAGVVPISFVGLDDSTMESTPTEYIVDGGHSGKKRSSTLPIVASVAIVASTQRGADYGKRWLARALRGAANVFCSGSDLRYLQWESGDSPIVHRRNVSLTRGITVTRKRSNHCSVTWVLSFTLTAADPFEYSEEFPSVIGLGGSGGQLYRTNLAVRPNVLDGLGWLSYGSEYTKSLNSTTPIEGSVSMRTTRAATNPHSTVSAIEIFYGGSPDPALNLVTPGGWFSAYVTARSSAASRLLNVQFRFRDETGSSFPGDTFNVATDVPMTSGVPIRVGGEVQVPASAYTVVVFVYVETFGANAPTGEVVDYDELVVEHAATAAEVGTTTYYDGNTPDGIDPETGSLAAYEWTGAADASSSTKSLFSSGVISSGTVALVETPCPAYDYSPIYDPLYPALVPAPAPPDFYPDGWSIVDGSTFDRFWARVTPVEPTDLDVVPVITLSTTVEARMVRVGIWAGDTEPDDQCGDLLFGAVVTYLPAGVDFFIDGEQKASYVWDGSSLAVRRTDSLVYSFDAKPVDWTKFNDHESLLITLDIFSDSSGVEGDGEVRASVSFVQKSD